MHRSIVPRMNRIRKPKHQEVEDALTEILGACTTCEETLNLPREAVQAALLLAVEEVLHLKHHAYFRVLDRALGEKMPHD